ncbi:hypothetical protein QFC24_003363 [Naganishia onofrii]|uniref:Uncharacterized protein n=1 Tax=Naganishia onofrii TaxID=1851511 RepID=A0ACC2XNH6_9TREE|nr:hypothetical protein QFC24_003363 [Naganishia onofrii]
MSSHHHHQRPSQYGTYKDTDTRPQPPLHLHTLPKGHGPAGSSSFRINTAYSLSSLEHAPSFVKAVGEYDELGRRLGDGATGIGAGNGKRKEGEALAFWKALDLAPRDIVQPISTPTTPHNQPAHTTDPAQSYTEASSSHTGAILHQPDKPRDNMPSSRPITSVAAAVPVVVPREQWFIRKALLAKARREQEAAAEDKLSDGGSGGSSSTGQNTAAVGSGSGSRLGAGVATPPSHSQTPSASLASLLSSSLPPPPPRAATNNGPTATGNDSGQEQQIQAYQPPAYFHLKPNNKGWQVLRNIGWDERGGLGPPLVEGVAGGSRERVSDDGGGVKQENGPGRVGHSVGADADPGAKGKGRNEANAATVIDLTTLDSDSDADSEPETTSTTMPFISEKFGQHLLSTDSAAAAGGSSNYSSVASASASSSGRTAPVATYFKTDRRGIGAISVAEQQRNLLRPSSLRARSPSSSSATTTTTTTATAGKRKRVTHTHEEIRAVAREQRGTGEGLMGEEKVVFDVKRSKRDVRVDREERQRWREIINM